MTLLPRTKKTRVLGKNIGFAEGVESWFLNAPAFKFNLKNIEPGDVIKRVGTQQVSSLSQFNKKVEASKKKGTLLLLIKKPSGSSQFITLNF